MIAFESFHKLNRLNNPKHGWVVIKINIEKAYERLEWNFIREALINMDIPTDFISSITTCITITNFNVLINRNPTGNINPTRGIRPWDPLSPYLFIICADIFSTLMKHAQTSHLITGIKDAKTAPNITHLLFADDSLIFYQDTTKEARNLSKIFQKYQDTSGQKINYNKSEIQFNSGKFPEYS